MMASPSPTLLQQFGSGCTFQSFLIGRYQIKKDFHCHPSREKSTEISKILTQRKFNAYKKILKTVKAG